VPILRPEVALSPPNLFELSSPERPWRVAHVRSRQEKGLARHLLSHGVAFYLPLHEKRMRRAGRTFVSQLPLFPGYVFFRATLGERRTALDSDLVAALLEVPDQERLEGELESLWRLQESGLPLVPHPYLGPGDEVVVVHGPLRGWTGTVLRAKGSVKLVVSVSFLRQSVAAEFEREALAPVPARPRAGRALAAAR